MTERAIEVADRVAVELAGEHDAVLRALEERLRLDINLRGNRVVLTGEDVRVERGVAVIDELARLVDSGRTLAPTMIEAVAAWCRSSASSSACGTTASNTRWPRTPRSGTRCCRARR
mgnify:CR=1 FL=1